ncbi:1319_t:CDS:2 [Rhizophagus irregularis]|nr:1319_t:CDS:2 [Rhizophagus irregularis]
MGNVLSLMDQPDDETYAPRYHNPQQHQTQYPLYTTTTTRQSSAPYHNMLTSTEEESTRQSYEQLRYERLRRERVKRKELEKFEIEQEEYAKKLREQESNPDIRQHVEYDSYDRQIRY